ncbi:MAG: hypothetical protein KDA85_16165, partial [Planctomycetaceae bacterium]|nr:hypothetical protein [Planctomycetaceae bacterium]
MSITLLNLMMTVLCSAPTILCGAPTIAGSAVDESAAVETAAASPVSNAQAARIEGKAELDA